MQDGTRLPNLILPQIELSSLNCGDGGAKLVNLITLISSYGSALRQDNFFLKITQEQKKEDECDVARLAEESGRFIKRESIEADRAMISTFRNSTMRSMISPSWSGRELSILPMASILMIAISPFIFTWRIKVQPGLSAAPFLSMAAF